MGTFGGGPTLWLTRSRSSALVVYETETTVAHSLGSATEVLCLFLSLVVVVVVAPAAVVRCPMDWQFQSAPLPVERSVGCETLAVISSDWPSCFDSFRWLMIHWSLLHRYQESSAG